MSYGNKKQCTASNGVRVKVIEPKRLLKRAADISAKTAIIIAAAVWLSGGVFQSAADTSDVKDAVGVIQDAEVENLSEDSAADDKSLTNTDIQNDFASCNVYAREECKDCWAKLYCSGGCAANAYHSTGSVRGVYKYGCELFRKRMECAIAVAVARELGGKK